MAAHGRIPTSSGATPAATSQLQLKATPAIRATAASAISHLRFRLKPARLHCGDDCERLKVSTIQFPFRRRRLLPSMGSSDRGVPVLHAHAVVKVEAQPRTRTAFTAFQKTAITHAYHYH